MVDPQRMAALTEFLRERLAPDGNVRERIERLYLPIYDWCLNLIQDARPVVVGINGSQGIGKSTLAQVLCELFSYGGFKATTISIDDFYLTRADQTRLAHDNPGNRYLQRRGYPGTHDLELGEQILTDLKGAQGSVQVPRYEKSLFEGKGDRVSKASWKTLELPLDLIFFEGWMLGFHPATTIADPALREINRRLNGYERWWSKIDALIQLKPRNYRFVIDWRVEAEEQMKASGRSGMTDAEVRDYVRSFLPAYEVYLPGLSFPNAERFLVVEIDRDRLPTGSIL